MTNLLFILWVGERLGALTEELSRGRLPGAWWSPPKPIHTHRTPTPQPEATAPQPPSLIVYLLTTAERNCPESGLSQPAWEVRPLAWVEYLLSAM